MSGRSENARSPRAQETPELRCEFVWRSTQRRAAASRARRTSDDAHPLRKAHSTNAHDRRAPQDDDAPALCAALGAPASEQGLGLVDALFHACLFAREDAPPPTTLASSLAACAGAAPTKVPPPKCKSAASRLAAFELLGVLARASPALFVRTARLCAAHHTLGLTPAQVRFLSARASLCADLHTQILRLKHMP